jgi:ribosomal protein L7/L12
MTVDRKWAAQVSPANGLLLRGYPSDRKIMVIKVIREFLGCGLLEAKTLSEQLPAVLGGTFGKPALDGFRDQLREAGADVELHYIPSALGPASVQSPTPSAGR